MRIKKFRNKKMCLLIDSDIILYCTIQGGMMSGDE